MPVRTALARARFADHVIVHIQLCPPIAMAVATAFLPTHPPVSTSTLKVHRRRRHLGRRGEPS